MKTETRIEFRQIETEILFVFGGFEQDFLKKVDYVNTVLNLIDLIQYSEIHRYIWARSILYKKQFGIIRSLGGIP